MSPQWYVQFSEQVYGPYASEQMAGFVKEGRIIPTSLITHDMSRGFYRASAYPVFMNWAEQDLAAATEQRKVASGASPAVQDYHGRSETPAQQQPVQQKAESVFLIMAEIRSGEAMRFLRALQAHGTAQRIGDTVWLLKAESHTEFLKDALSQTLTRQDRLFIVDCFRNKTAWFNIGADLDQRIRTFWESADA